MATYIGDNTARLAGALEPAVVTLSTVYVMAWGYLHLTGKIEEPVLAGLKRIVVLALVLGAGLHLWLYNTLIVDTFYNAPARLAAAVVGAADPVATIDAIWERGGAVAGSLWSHTSLSIGFYLAGAMVWCLMGLLCVYAMFLIALSSIALAVLLALGPLFIALLLFESTKRFVRGVDRATGQLRSDHRADHHGGGLCCCRSCSPYADQTAALGSAIVTVDALHMVLVAVLVFLIMRQVMPIAAGLAGGVSLSSMGLLRPQSRMGNEIRGRSRRFGGAQDGRIRGGIFGASCDGLHARRWTEGPASRPARGRISVRKGGYSSKGWQRTPRRVTSCV